MFLPSPLFYCGDNTRKTRFVTVLGVAVGVLMLSGPMFAHHSQSIYDMRRGKP
jgi:hypothetical protein